MIRSLYLFYPKSFLNADEWNANFKTLYNETITQVDTIDSARDAIAFTVDDLSGVFNQIDLRPNSFNIPGTTQVIQADCEYYKTLGNGQDLSIVVPKGMNGNARIVIKTSETRVLAPITFNYAGGEQNVFWFNGISQWYNAGTKFVFVCERDGKVFVKMITTE